MSLLLQLLRSSWKAGMASILLGAISGPATLGLIMLIHRAVSKMGTDTWNMASVFALACVGVLTTQVVSKCILVRLSQSTAARLQYELCMRIMAAPLPTLESLGPHRILTTLKGDVGSITVALSNFPTVCASAMVLVSGIVCLAFKSPSLAACTVVLAAIGVGSYLLGIRWANMHMRRARENQDDVSKQLQDLVFGIRELKGNNRRSVDFFYDVLLPADTVMRERLIKGMDVLGLAHAWGRLALFIGIGLLVFVWPRFWPVSATTLTGYTFIILYLMNPLNSILGWLPSFNSAVISLQKINTLGLMIDPSDSPPVDDLPTHFQSIELQGVTYRYESPTKEEQGFQLGPIDLQVFSGEVLFIAGGNGCGKTTLAKLLNGLYPPRDGQVLLNGSKLDERSLGNYRQLFSTVYVEGHLFDRLIGVDVDPIQLKYWLARFGIEDKVDVETGMLATDRLSRGQHKRLALLVAFMDDRPIFLFDEWAAEQDPTFKEVFYQEILPELKRRGKTVVAITHDDRYFFAADRVVKLVDGRVDDDQKRIAA